MPMIARAKMKRPQDYAVALSVLSPIIAILVVVAIECVILWFVRGFN